MRKLPRYLPPATKLRQGNVFTPVCSSVHRGVCHPSPGQTPPGRHPPGQKPPQADTPPAQCMLGYGQQAGGTHPTGMYSCLIQNLTLSRQRSGLFYTVLTTSNLTVILIEDIQRHCVNK